MQYRSSLFRPAAAATFAAVAIYASAVPARADVLPPVSVELGAQFLPQSNARTGAGDTQLSVGANYDIWKVPLAPVKVSLRFDEANGGGQHGSTFNEYGFGVTGQLTTPLYAGAGFSVYNTSVGAVVPAPGITSLNGGRFTSSSTALGEEFFVGDRFLSLPGGVNFALQATYKDIPQYNGFNPSAVAVGLRVQL